MSAPYIRPQAAELEKRLKEPRRFIQVVAGPRQVGKTTLVNQVLVSSGLPSHYASADEPGLRDSAWVQSHWDTARTRAQEAGPGGAVLVLDEVQKIPDWSETVKWLWDQDTLSQLPLKVILLGSAPLLVQSGLSESLAGRFEVIRLPHWSFSEMRDAFGFNLDQFEYFGGYPGAAAFISDETRWRQYVLEALIEPTISRDVLLMTRVDKPALLRQLFGLACRYSGQVLSYTKMLGQLQDAGNTTTLAHYLDLLAGAGMIIGLQKFSGSEVRRRASSPKLQVMNNALMTAQSQMSFEESKRDNTQWGRLLESAVGAHLANAAATAPGVEVSYWRQGDREVDFVVRARRNVMAIEVKSGRTRNDLLGMSAFAAHFRPDRQLLIGGDGVPVETFLSRPVEHWVS